ncbi:Rieske 2Fe-2S domain-containing protein [Xanthobacter pseudotagetidis]|uniref:Rieske 2Fe-2S domain-containing protein n=1 Tax=Xanthobacter pseudotagetidis TaxID=3119911 RepID=UPI00372BC0E7
MFTRVCKLETIPEGGMCLVIASQRHVILAWPDDGALRAFQGVCPHSGTPLSEAAFDGTVLICPSHFWTWDMNTGAAIEPRESALAEYPVKVEDGIVYVDAEAAQELFAPQ